MASLPKSKLNASCFVFLKAMDLLIIHVSENLWIYFFFLKKKKRFFVLYFLGIKNKRKKNGFVTKPKCFLSSFKLINRASESISLRSSIFCFQAKVLHLQQATLPHVSVCATHSQREHNHQRRHIIIIISVHSPPHNQHHRLLLLIQIL